MSAIVSITRTDQKTTISIRSRLNFEVHTQFRNAYLEETRDKNSDRYLIIDLTGVEYIDSTGLGMLLLGCPNPALAVDQFLDGIFRRRHSCVYAATLSG